MRIGRLGLVHSVDLVIVASLLVGVLIVPIAFLVPFNDEWLRINYLADHSVWEWTVLHSLTWVVRPTSELIMGWAALPTTRPALAHDFTPEAFLSRFHGVYFVLAFSYCALLCVNAALLSGRLFSREAVALAFFAVLACWLTSEEPGFGFYWIDGYGNVLIPFVLLTSGLSLLARSERLGGLSASALLILLGALGHEVLCIYALGVLVLCTALRRPHAEGWLRWSVAAGLLLLCGAILGFQLFSDGPRVRNEVYLRSTGTLYNFDVALQSVLQIQPLRAFACVLAPVLAVAIYRDQLASLIDRARADFARNRLFWVLLALGTVLTCCLPLASVGLKKGRLTVALYSTLTHLLFMLLGFLLCPMLDKLSERLLRGYRRWVGSILPVVFVLIAISGNRDSFRDAIVRRGELKAQALGYMTKLFQARDRVNLCRPDHPYVKEARGLTDRGERDYFRLNKVRHRCPKRP